MEKLYHVDVKWDDRFYDGGLALIGDEMKLTHHAVERLYCDEKHHYGEKDIYRAIAYIKAHNCKCFEVAVEDNEVKKAVFRLWHKQNKEWLCIVVRKNLVVTYYDCKDNHSTTLRTDRYER